MSGLKIQSPGKQLKVKSPVGKSEMWFLYLQGTTGS